jgi:hypothetical protein
MISSSYTISKLLRSPEKQHRSNSYFVFLGIRTNTYRQKNKKTQGELFHLGRGDISKGTVRSSCNLATGQFDCNPYLGSWQILNREEIKADPRYKEGKFCKRCIKQVGLEEEEER